jgi:hypothetical protein
VVDDIVDDGPFESAVEDVEVAAILKPLTCIPHTVNGCSWIVLVAIPQEPEVEVWCVSIWPLVITEAHCDGKVAPPVSGTTRVYSLYVIEVSLSVSKPRQREGLTKDSRALVSFPRPRECVARTSKLLDTQTWDREDIEFWG